jgi:chromosome segregation protein
VRLKQLEIKGFKSFADKTVVNLDNQITGIVGPNGCGKSNIVDAIRWVIGEHKIRALRSDNLEDLVFNGSRSRNASGLAEVALTFENTRNLLPTEFNTVTITRKFYKSGESEYRLNDVTCRLKDITNLFLDTGVSTDSYAIIELGMVDDIIKDKENSRRRMLEQAAGISIYKTRKKEAKLKLDATEQDLSRIEDLLFEISNNLRTLESQAKKAEKYLQIKAEYREVSIELVKASLENFNSTYQKLSVQQQGEVDKILEFDAKIAAEDAALQKDKLALADREQALQALQKSFNALTADILMLENDKSLSAQRIEHLKQLRSKTESFLKDADKQSVELRKSIETTQKQLQAEKASLSSVQEKVNGLRANLDDKRQAFDTEKAALDTLRKEQQALQMRHFETEKTVAVADNSVANINLTLTQIAAEIAQRSEEVATQKQLVVDFTAKGSNFSSHLTELLAKRDEASQKILAAQSDLEDLRAKLVDTNRIIDSKRNEYQLLKSLVESFEGYPDSIKYLHKNAAWQTNAPLLGDVLDVPEQYRIAIESYLEQYLNYYVVATAADAYNAIDLLDKNKKGKAGFFILDEVPTQGRTATSIDNAVAAIDCLQVAAQYKSLVQYLIGDVYISSADTGNGHADATIVSASGRTVRKQHSVAGGAVGLFEGNKVGRTQRLDKLTTEISTAEEAAMALQKKITAKQNEIVGFNEDLNESAIKKTEQEIAQLNNQKIQAEGRIENFNHIVSSNNNRAEQLTTQLAQTQDNIKEARAQFVQLNLEIASTQKLTVEKEQGFKATEADYNKASEEYYQQNVILTRQQGRISELTNEDAIRTKQLQDIQTRVVQSTTELTKGDQDIALTEQQLKVVAEQLYELLQKKATDEKVLNETDQAFYNFRNELTSKEEVLNKERKKKADAEGILNDLRERLGEMKLQLSGMKERLQLEFKIDINEVLKGARTTETAIEVLQEDSAKLKKRIENLGEVNPMAVEAFREVKARYDFIVEQKGDLVNAKDSLLQTIEEVENTANKKFLETFNQVRENFVKVFHALFTEEDHCDLKLVDPENIADTTIEIYAQPKGKRPSTITQLSGGEKTLTSTAFLFAIYLIKPAPFCILDEVDAPLDDANVAKFTNMIRRFSHNSQFIIVTHNKQTMSAVDVIYGVTMQEAGVSKLVPVDFRSLN